MFGRLRRLSPYWTILGNSPHRRTYVSSIRFFEFQENLKSNWFARMFNFIILGFHPHSSNRFNQFYLDWNFGFRRSMRVSTRILRRCPFVVAHLIWTFTRDNANIVG